MPTYEVKDFTQGMDLRKMYSTAPAGSLRLLRNAAITPGAEIEKRNAFVPYYTVDSSSFGLIQRNGLVYTVKVGTTPSIVDPVGSSIGVVTIVAPAGITLVGLNDWDLFNGNFYLVMAGSAGKFWHYFNQAQVTDGMATSAYVRTYGTKMYGLDGRLLRFSAVNDPTQWTPPPPATANGSGYIDLSAQDADSTSLVGMEVYYNQMAIFSSLSTQFWNLDPNPANNAFKQLLRQTGLVARHAVIQFGSGDVIYLSPYGIRSLRVQNISLTAGTTDIGTPIDQPVRDLLWANGKNWFHTARMLVQPRTGRLWLVLPDRVYVLSTFQEPAITAWSIFDFPAGLTIQDCVVADPYIYLRGSDGNVYLYGGVRLDVFDNTEAEVETPALSFEKPNVIKLFTAFDVACEGTWAISASLDPTNEAAEELVSTVTNGTFLTGIERMPGQSTHLSLRLRTTDASQARLGKILVTFETGEEK